jgi:hypothetical protein
MNHAAPQRSQYGPHAHAFKPPITRTSAPRYTHYSPRLLAVVDVFLNKKRDLCTPESFRIQNPLESAPALRLGGCQKLKIPNVIVGIFSHRCSPNTLITAFITEQSTANLRTTKTLGLGWKSIDFSAQGGWQWVFPTRQWSGLFSSVYFGLQRCTARLELAGDASLSEGTSARFDRMQRGAIRCTTTVIERRDASLLLANRHVVKASDALVVR